MRVKDMPRKQQKAVFANMENPSTGSPELYNKRQYLIKKGELNETREDKINDVWLDKKLTFREKVMRIEKIKKSGTKTGRTQAVSSGFSQTNRDVLYTDAYSTKEEAEGVKKVLESEGKPNVIIFKDKEGDYNLAHNYPKEEQGPEKGTIVLVGRKAINVPPRTQKLNHAEFAKSVKLEAALMATKEYQDNRRKGLDHVQSLNEAHLHHSDKFLLRAQPRILGEKRKVQNMPWKQLKKKGLKANSDYDKDGVKNVKDCRPMDKNRQDLGRAFMVIGSRVARKTVRGVQSYAERKAIESRPEYKLKKAREREAHARAKYEYIKEKERADRAEGIAKRAEQDYKRRHPKKWGLF